MSDKFVNICNQLVEELRLNEKNPHHLGELQRILTLFLRESKGMDAEDQTFAIGGKITGFLRGGPLDFTKIEASIQALVKEVCAKMAKDKQKGKQAA